jgi:hypothetical protein
MPKKKKNNQKTLPAKDAAMLELKPLSEKLELEAADNIKFITPDAHEDLTDLCKLINYRHLEEFMGSNKNKNTEEALKLIKIYDRAHLKEYKYVGESYLMLAVKNGLPEVAKALLPFSDINYKSIFSGKTALHIAAHKYNIELYKFLEEDGADTTITDNSGRTAKDWIKENTSHIGMYKIYGYYAQAEAIELMAKAILAPEEINKAQQRDEYKSLISKQDLLQPSLGKEELPDITSDKNELNPLSDIVKLSGEAEIES